jgi:hypothetical protein
MIMKTPPNKNSRPLLRKSLIGLGVLATLMAMIIIVAPPILSIMARNILLDVGADQVELEDVDFNPFTGRLALHQLQVRADGTRIIGLDYGHIQLELLPLLKKKLNIIDIELNQGFLYLLEQNNGTFGIKGLDFNTQQTAPRAENDAQWHFGIDEAHIRFTSVRMETPRLKPTIASFDELTLTTLYSWERDRLSNLIARGSIADGNFDIDIQMTPLANLPKYAGSMLVNSLALNHFQPLLQEQLSKLGGLIQLKSDFEIVQQNQNQWNIEILNVLESSNLVMAMDELMIESELFRFNGQSSIQLHLKDQGSAITLGGQGKLEALKPYIQAAGYHISGKQLTWSGNNSMSMLPETDLKLEITGDAKASDLIIRDQSGLRLAELSDVRAEKTLFRLPYALKSSTVKLGKGNILRPSSPDAHPIAEWIAVELDQLALNEEQVDLQHVYVNQLAIKLHFDQTGKLVLPLPASNEQSTTTQPKSRPDDKNSSFHIRVAEIKLSNKSQIEVTDTSLTPTYHGQLTLDRAQMSHIDSTKPEQASKLLLSGILNRYAPVKIEGEVKPFKDIPDVDLKSSIRSIDLTRLSPYSRRYAGYDIKAGTMDIDSKLKITNSQIDDRIQLTLHKASIEVSDKEKASQTDEALNIGLPAALSMMKDSKGNIKLDLPIKGDLNDPQFDFGPAIRSALAKALTQTSTAYVAYAIQPYGLALLVTKVAGKIVTRVEFDPLLFEPGAGTPPESLNDYLEKISTVMKNRPGLELRVCGFATADEKKHLKDKAEPEQALKELASTRAYAIKDLLIGQYAIDASRLLACSPDIDPGPEAKPRVELSM